MDQLAEPEQRRARNGAQVTFGPVTDFPLTFRAADVKFDSSVENKLVSRVMGVRERQAREREARLEAIRRAALCLFAERGFAATSMDDVAAAAELGKGTLYYYFPSKEALLENVLDTYVQRFFENLQGSIDVADDLFTAIRKILFAYIDFHAENPEFFRIHHRWMTEGVSEAHVQLRRFRERYRELRAPLDRLLKEKAEQQFTGRLCPEVILNLVGGLLLIYGGHLQRGRSIDEVRELVEQTLTLLQHGLRGLRLSETDRSK